MSYALADHLQELGVPFLFVTGYDRAVIPPRFWDSCRLHKPVEFRTVVQALAELVRIAPS